MTFEQKCECGSVIVSSVLMMITMIVSSAHLMLAMIVSSGGRGDEQPACKQHQEAGAGDADDDADGDADDYVDGDDNDDVDGDAYYLI